MRNTAIEIKEGWEFARQYLEQRRSKPNHAILIITLALVIWVLGMGFIFYDSRTFPPVSVVLATLLCIVCIKVFDANRPCPLFMEVRPEEFALFPPEAKSWLHSLAVEAVTPLTYGDIDRAILDRAGLALKNRRAARSDELLLNQRAMLDSPTNVDNG